METDAEHDITQLRIAPQAIVDLIYDTLECVHQVLTENNIRYTAFCGTVLGAERHGGLIPWDDDADIAILDDDEERLAALSDTFAKRGFVLTRADYVGFRVRHATLAKPRPVDHEPCPFVDIFLFRDTGSQYEHTTSEARDYWKSTFVPYGAFDRLVDVPFGHLTVRSMSAEDAQRHLDDSYGNDWPQVAWRDFDHCSYETVPNVRVPLTNEKVRQPARHSKMQ